MATTAQLKALNELLKQHGQDSSISVKRSVWKLKGLDKRLGRYEGTPSQVKALSKSLKKNPITDPKQYWLKPGESMEAYSQRIAGLRGETTATKPIQPAPQVAAPTVTGATDRTKQLIEESTQVAQQAARVAGLPEFEPGAVTTPTGVVQTAAGKAATAGKTTAQIQAEATQAAQTAQKVAGLPPETYTPPSTVTPKPTPAPTTIVDDTTPTTGSTAGTTATDAADVLGIPNIPSAQSIMEDILASEEFKITQERLGLNVTTAEGEAEAAHEAAEAKYESDKTALENQLAAQGLAFSGIRVEQVRALGEELAASKLAADRKLAAALMDANLDLKEAIYSTAADLVKEAQAGRKEAFAQLNKAGLAIVNGTLVPTIEAQKHALALEKEARIEEMEAARFDLQQAQFAFTQAKTDIQLQQAQERIDIAQRRLELSEAIAADKQFNIISQATLNKLAAAGVPNNVALWIQTNMNAGVPEQDLINELTGMEGMNVDSAQKVMSDFKSVMVRSAEDELMALLMGLAG